MFELSLLILSVLIIVFDVRGEVIGDTKELAESVQNVTIERVLYRISNEFSEDGSLKGKLMKWAADKTINEAKKLTTSAKIIWTYEKRCGIVVVAKNKKDLRKDVKAWYLKHQRSQCTYAYPVKIFG